MDIQEEKKIALVVNGNVSWRERITVAIVAGLLTFFLVGMLEYWLWRPQDLGDLSILARLQANPGKERLAIHKGLQCGLGCGMVVGIGIVGFSSWKKNPRKPVTGRRRRILGGCIYGYLAGFWMVKGIAGGSDHMDRMLMLRVSAFEDTITAYGPLLSGLICAFMIGLHLFWMYPESVQKQPPAASP